MLVKICGLSSRDHVQVAIDAGADAVGYVLSPFGVSEDSGELVERGAAAVLSYLQHGLEFTMNQYNG